MQTRPATLDDLTAITELQRSWDTHWFGAPENDENEVREHLERVPDGQSVLLHDGTNLVGAAWWWSTDTALLADPDSDPDTVQGTLLDWLASAGAPHIQTLVQDTALLAALSARGWRKEHSSFELLRAVTPDWELDEPVWPEGVEMRPATSDDLPAIHHLVYQDAQWASVPGHVAREFDEWRSLFAEGADAAADPVVAWRGDRIVGVSLGRIFSDGAGWVSQLAVAVPERRQGLGRALLLESMRRRHAAGATALGLGVEANNDRALELYLDVGLRIDREWQTFLAPTDRGRPPSLGAHRHQPPAPDVTSSLVPST